MDNNFQIFIVFHKFIFDECYKNIPQDVLYNNFTFIAVNEKIEKKYTENKYKIINEWELPIYDKSFQERGYNENSALYHIYINNLHKKYDMVGFFQYDMIFNDNIIDYLEKNVNENPIFFPFSIHNFNYCTYETWNDPVEIDFIIQDYEEFHNKKFSKDEMYPLYNSYIISSEVYEKIMKWIIQLYDKLYPIIMKHKNSLYFWHVGAVFERVMAYAIGNEKIPYKSINVTHDHKYKNQSY
jgi:hypothetical protein